MVNLQISKQQAAIIGYITKQSSIFVKEEEEGGWELSSWILNSVSSSELKDMGFFGFDLSLLFYE